MSLPQSATSTVRIIEDAAIERGSANTNSKSRRYAQVSVAVSAVTVVASRFCDVIWHPLGAGVPQSFNEDAC